MASPSDTYDEAYYRETMGVGRLRRFGMSWWSARMYARLTAWCLRRNRGRRLLEIGCGPGHVLGFLHERFDATGTDLSPWAIEQCAKTAPRARCEVVDLCTASPFPAASFDVVLARYVFEHVPDPSGILARAHELLRPGGTLLFAVPNTDSLGARRKGADWYALGDPTHCSLFAPERWLELTRAAGFEIAREFSDGHWDLPYLTWLPTWAQAPIFLGPPALACLAGRPLLPARFGENVIVVADRPDPSTAEQPE